MKKNIIYSTLAALLITACTDDELVPMQDQTALGDEVTISVGMPGEGTESRVIYDDVKGLLQWEDGKNGTNPDELIVAGYKDNQFVGLSDFGLTRATVYKNYANFSGHLVKDATHYKVYYKAENLTVDEKSGEATMNYDGQIQSDLDNTTHLKKYLLLHSSLLTKDDFLSSFNLALENRVMRFDIDGLKENMGELNRIVWKNLNNNSANFVELLIAKESKSWTDGGKAYVCFDPKAMKLDKNGTFQVILTGSNFSYRLAATSTNGKDYTSANRYHVAIINGTPDPEKPASLSNWEILVPSNEIWFKGTKAPQLNNTDFEDIKELEVSMEKAEKEQKWYKWTKTEGHITEIPAHLFWFKKSNKVISEIKLPEGVKVINDEAFVNNEALKVVSPISEVTSIGEKVFSNCKSLLKVELPATLTTIKKSAFEHCDALTEVKILASAATLGEGIDSKAFNGLKENKVELILDKSWWTASEGKKPVGKSWMGNNAWKSIVDPDGNTAQNGQLPTVTPDETSPF